MGCPRARVRMAKMAAATRRGRRRAPVVRVVLLLAGIGAFGCAGLAAQAEGAVTAQSVAAGERHTCAVLSSGHVDCWGGNEEGQLGNGRSGSKAGSATPVEVQGISNASQVTAGGEHTCALLSGGQIDCWGDNSYGDLGNGTTSDSDTPVEVHGISNAIQVTAGAHHTCALLSDGRVDCWGDGFYGQLGNASTSDSDTPVEVQGVSNAIQVTAGTWHTCALLSGAHIDCWGDGSYGELGNGAEGESAKSDTPMEVQGIGSAIQVTAGGFHTCAVLSGGHVDCWGENFYGELGNGMTRKSDTPVEVQGITDAVQLTAGERHTCAVLSGGHVECWGENGWGELGDGTTSDSDTPVEAQGISDANQLTAGSGFTCALLSTGRIGCWGNNYYGQLGNGGKGESDVPVEVQAISNASQVTAGGYHTCALLSRGHVDCWGASEAGELGNGTTGDSDTPVEVLGIGNSTQVTAGSFHTCALLSGGHVDCWGANEAGELGNGTGGESAESDTPVKVRGISNATEVTAGSGYTCALLSSGHVDCWGENEYGELGNGKSGDEADSHTPVEVQGISSATEVKAGDEHACALLSSGHIDCWGENEDGELGNGTTGTDSDTPVEVQGIGNATQVTAGVRHTCALLSGGHIDCWGANEAGQLGNGTTNESDTPVEVLGISNAAQVTAGGFHTCALLSGGHIDCWGDSAFGEPESDTPVEVQGISSANQVTAGQEHTCALLSTGQIDCWGADSEGQLGDDEPWAVVPTEVLFGGTPVAVTGTASSVTGVSATLNATVNPDGGEVTGCEFEYGPTSTYGSSVPCSSLPGSGESAVDVSASVSGLSARSTYHFRIVATDAGGTSYGADATFTTESLGPEFGRCAKVPVQVEGHKKVYNGGFTTSTCTVASPTHTGPYEWQAGVEKAGFMIMGAAVKLETPSKARVTCVAVSGMGQITGLATVGAVVMTFSGCESEGGKCTTSGQSEGVLESEALEGNLGWEQKTDTKVALALYPVGQTGPFMQYSCAGNEVVLAGSVLAPAETNKMSQTNTLEYAAGKGKQMPEAFEGQPADVLENSRGEQVGLSFKATQTDEEAVEINTAF
jgi:alpha-tubulin suppressor-like RCC1 family protein